jgi:hypothetical protein
VVSPPQRKPEKMKALRITALAIAAAAAIAGCGSATHATTPAATTLPATPVYTPAAATSAPPATPTTVTFYVSGTAVSGAGITYGTDTDNRSPAGGLGLGGSGTALPWHASIPFDPAAQYYTVSAQLQGDTAGNITCTIVVSGPGDTPLTVAHGHASGGYNICDAQAAPDDPTGVSWQPES